MMQQENLLFSQISFHSKSESASTMTIFPADAPYLNTGFIHCCQYSPVKIQHVFASSSSQAVRVIGVQCYPQSQILATEVRCFQESWGGTSVPAGLQQRFLTPSLWQTGAPSGHLKLPQSLHWLNCIFLCLHENFTIKHLIFQQKQRKLDLTFTVLEVSSSWLFYTPPKIH